jgi:hypothetical protein
MPKSAKDFKLLISNALWNYREVWESDPKAPFGDNSPPLDFASGENSPNHQDCGAGRNLPDPGYGRLPWNLPASGKNLSQVFIQASAHGA